MLKGAIVLPKLTETDTLEPGYQELMRQIIFIPLLMVCGCVGPETSLIDPNADARHEDCAANQKKIESDHRTGASCRPHPGLFEQVGNALSGSASAFRAPGP
jgi:hypothetical protein